MNFDKQEEVESICQQIRLADWPRGQNRAKINNLFNGFPPFSQEEVNTNNINVNVNFLEGTVLSHDARAQFYNAFLKPGQFFTATTDAVKPEDQQQVSEIVTAEMNKVMKRSMNYFETFRSKFAMLVLHGVGPSCWADSEHWCPDAIGIEDVGIPGNTLLTMKNLPFFYVYRSFTAPELMALTKDRKKSAASGWNMDMVDNCIKWVDANVVGLMGKTWPEIWSPEKTQERIKGDGGFYAGDQIPTIDCFDFYFRSTDSKKPGWNRRIVMDAWSVPSGNGNISDFKRDESKKFGNGQFLFNPKGKIYGKEFSQLMSFQFADLSAVAPFRYHNVRSLGFLVYAVCHLQNRLRCRFSEAQFEALMNYFRVRSADDTERALKLDLINRGFVDETIEFIPPNQRWQVNAQLVELGLAENNKIIQSNSSSFTQQPSGHPGDRKTRMQVMSEITQMTSLVQSAFNQAYQYQEAEYREIFRRFCNKDSEDEDIKKFHAAIAKRGIDKKVLDPDSWELEPTRVMGAGNKTMEMAIAEQLLGMRNLFDPEPQREILREVTFNITGDADKAARWVPPAPLRVSDSVHDAQLAMGTLMQGLPVAVKTGQNHREYVTVLVSEMESIIQKYEQNGGMAPADKIEGLQNVAQNIGEHIQILSQDPNEKAFVTEAQKHLAKLMNYVKAFMQRLQQQMKKQQEQQGGDPKVKSALIMAQTKAKLAQESHAQKTAQRQIQFELDQKREDMKTQAQIKRENLKTVHESRRKIIESKANGE